MKNIVLQALFYFLIGAAIMCGIRAIEWIIPKPAIVTFICIVSDAAETECKTLDELKADARGTML